MRSTSQLEMTRRAATFSIGSSKGTYSFSQLTGTRIISGPAGGIGGCLSREHQAMQGRRERRRSACSRARRRRMPSVGPLKLLQVAEVVLPVQPEIGDAVAQHRD